MAVNNAATVVRPNLWTCVDDPGNFSDAIWRDPGIVKFVPEDHFAKEIFIRDAKINLIPSTLKVRDMPVVFGYARNERFVAESFLTEKTICWGNSAGKIDELGQKGSRSVMLVALRLLHHLGCRIIYLLGCDFRMEYGKQNYAFEQDRSPSSVRGNNRSYEILNYRLAALKPYFDATGVQIYNSTPHSELTAFPTIEYAVAIQRAIAEQPNTIITSGMYDRVAREREQAKKSKHILMNADSGISMTPLEFTTIVAVDELHLPELRLVWPTWEMNRPEILKQPLLIICDGNRSLSSWEEQLRFVNHPEKRLVSWNMTDVSQREKMLTGLVVCAATKINTPWYLKLDTDVAAIRSGNWLDLSWFSPSQDGRMPVFIAPAWGYTKPANILTELDKWGDNNNFIKSFPRLNFPIRDGQERFCHPRIISWCFFGNTDWTKKIWAECGERLPVPSQDTFLWYCAHRRGDYYVRQRMNEHWAHIKNRRRLQAACLQAISLHRAKASPEVLGADKTPHSLIPQVTNRGVLYLLTGIKHAVRLAVSIASLRRYFAGPVTIMSTQPESHALVGLFTKDHRLNVSQLQIPHVQREKNSAFLTKVAMLPHTPYETSLFLDADTLVTGSIEPLFEAAEDSGFATTQFSKWVTSGRKMQGRIRSWFDVPQTLFSREEFHRLLLENLQGLPAINCGVHAYRRGIPLLQSWWSLVDAGWDRFICDEVALQILLPRFPHRILDHRFNFSPRYGPPEEDARIWHFHGGKHLSPGLAAEKWLPALQTVWHENIADIQAWYPAQDQNLHSIPPAQLTQYAV
ncbi:MAG: hypothetical protein SFX18_17555 [Pirellulales bacterium]|nr:hypothetical protein [Pirellulales bacterium]